MSDFLEGYGVTDARREHRVKTIVWTVVGLIVVGIAGYLWLRNFREEHQAKLFFDLLRKQDYQAAYRLWGCTPETPCRDYAFDKFMEDWGPKSPHTGFDTMKVSKTRSCAAGIIQILDFGGGETVNLYVQRKDLVLSFSPWEFCNPRWQAPK
jgi:hypothetical protein